MTDMSGAQDTAQDRELAAALGLVSRAEGADDVGADTLAESLLSRAVAEAPTRAEPLLARGEYFIRWGRIREAELDLRRAAAFAERGGACDRQARALLRVIRFAAR